MCNVDAAVVDVEEDGVTKQEYHVVIKMPAEIKDEISQFAVKRFFIVFRCLLSFFIFYLIAFIGFILAKIFP